MKLITYKIREYLKYNILRPLLLNFGFWISKYSLVSNEPVLDSSKFEFSEILENNYAEIRKEMESILAFHSLLPNLQDIQQEQRILTCDNNWKTFFLFGFGKKAILNCASCPATTSILEQIPGLETAFFSILLPHKHIDAHKGIFKGFIRGHLGLVVPKKAGKCYLRVDNQILHWQERKVIVFDDTYEHEVWNNSNEIRVVLLVDIIRPLKFPFAYINKGIIRLIGNSSYVQEAFQKNKEWEVQFHSNRTITNYRQKKPQQQFRVEKNSN
jgi:aspartyl/asparaginyl beta-hydroxylase (cupin superfamily)